MTRAISYIYSGDKEEYHPPLPITTLNMQIEKISIKFVETNLKERGNFTFEFDNKNILQINKSDGIFYGIGFVEYYQISFGEYCYDKEDGESYLMAHTQYFSLNNFDDAVKCFVGRLVSTTPFNSFDKSQTLEEIKEISAALSLEV